MPTVVSLGTIMAESETGTNVERETTTSFLVRLKLLHPWIPVRILRLQRETSYQNSARLQRRTILPSSTTRKMLSASLLQAFRLPADCSFNTGT